MNHVKQSSPHQGLSSSTTKCVAASDKIAQAVRQKNLAEKFVQLHSEVCMLELSQAKLR